MVVCHQISEIKKELSSNVGGLGLVPTMGALHAGHLGLIEKAVKENEAVAVTIFVNPVQFNRPKDYEAYPIDLEADLELLARHQVNYVFAPSKEEIYPEKEVIKLQFGAVEKYMEGQFRPGHFSGVGIVLTKLFNIIRPDKVYFGQKDLQQVAIVKKLVRDFFYDLEVVTVETIREEDGLAASSRNKRLSASHRSSASVFYQALQQARAVLNQGSPIDEARKEVEKIVHAVNDASLEYFEVVDSHTLIPLAKINPDQTISLCIAGYLGDVRLLDNIYLTKL